MATFLIRTAFAENAQRYDRGDIVAAFDDGHIWGRMESLKVWTDEGNSPSDWPGGFLILELTNLPLQQAQNFLVRTSARRSEYNIDIDAILTQIPQSKVATYNTERRLTFNWNNAAVKAYIKQKT